MKTFFKDIFGYHKHYNQQLIDVFTEHLSTISERSIPLLSHCINAHQIWNSRILATEPLPVFEKHSLETCRTLDLSNYNDTLIILSEKDFNMLIAYTNSKGHTYTNSVQEILFHIANHYTHHKGQLISDLRQHGIEPPVTDYIFYKR